MARPSELLELNGGQRWELERMISGSKTPQRMLAWAQIVLLRSADRSLEVTAVEVGVSRPAVICWERRLAGDGLAGWEEAPGRGPKPSIPEAKKDRIITHATQPPPNRTRWSVRSMALHTGVSPASVQRIRAANENKPHLTRTFKLSRDPHFETKFWDVIGLWLNPPDEALVLGCDEKSLCQVLERTQPGSPLGTGPMRTRTHDYTRHGTVTVFAALNDLDGRIPSTMATQHTRAEWLTFLKKLPGEKPPWLALHLIVDNDATHQHAAFRAWLEKHPRVHLHFTPTGSSRLGPVERLFRQLTDDVVREGSCASVKELVTGIKGHLAHHHLKPTPDRWKAEGAAIMEKIQCARLAPAKAVL